MKTDLNTQDLALLLLAIASLRSVHLRAVRNSLDSELKDYHQRKVAQLDLLASKFTLES